jgi:hypothetical protein
MADRICLHRESSRTFDCERAYLMAARFKEHLPLPDPNQGLCRYPLKLRLLHFPHTQPDRLRSVNRGAAQPNLNTTITKAINVPFPPFAEQTRIVTEVERQLSVVEELKEVVSVNLQRASRLRQSILQKAFSGSV